ncbi:MAG TPA: hypothetical protein P5158_04245 [Chitinophagaceae bacterium]|nr:hypothetical protein [Chitinophagaceae bacterium]MCB9055407.1 hypothetical protein [Chitinophagales bacterium]HRX93298.1 hypothetical protein [Chitinophagaceae bacterium]
MRFSLFVFILLFVTASCNRSALDKHLAGCDSLVITFNYPDTDSVINSISTTDTKAIQKLKQYIDGKKDTARQCGFDGNMIFFRDQQQVLPVVFKYSNESCRQFLYEINSAVSSYSMSNEAADFLSSLVEGRSWY